jgi:deoxyribodipyrimidine photo-lyase
MKYAVVWFRNDLRLRDNPVLEEALRMADQVIPFYCFDPHFYEDTYLGFPRTGSFRAQFRRESVAALQASLQERGSDLYIHYGTPMEGLRELARRYDFQAIYTAREETREEREREDRVSGNGWAIMRISQHELYRAEDLPFDREERMPGVYTAFRKKVEKYAEIRPEIPAPDQVPIPEDLPETSPPSLSTLGLPSVEGDERGVLAFQGGEAAAWQRLQHYLWDTQQLSRYKITRNGLLGADYSSKFSAWLAAGCLSPVSIYWQIKAYEQQIESNSSTYWLYFELMWRDFFRHLAGAHGDAFFRMPRHWQPRVDERFEQWSTGETGQDFVDANMRELFYTGYMSNRGRQNVASYLVRELEQPWYAGALWFESQLIDHDVCSNYGNWTYVAGVGNDPRKHRWFNVNGQAQRYDADGSYRRHWGLS